MTQVIQTYVSHLSVVYLKFQFCGKAGKTGYRCTVNSQIIATEFIVIFVIMPHFSDNIEHQIRYRHLSWCFIAKIYFNV